MRSLTVPCMPPAQVLPFACSSGLHATLGPQLLQSSQPTTGTIRAIGRP